MRRVVREKRARRGSARARAVVKEEGSRSSGEGVELLRRECRNGRN